MSDLPTLEINHDGYPTDATLATLETWPIDRTEELWQKLARVWVYVDSMVLTPEWVIIHADGWSGHEDILTALRKNLVFWASHWEQERRGGHYLFRRRLTVTDHAWDYRLEEDIRKEAD